MDILNGITGTAIGLGMASWQDARQLEQQRELQALQIAGQKEMGKFNQGLALDMWNKTNYEAQVQHMRNAGLNVGLMYKGSGQGGTTSTPTGNVTGGTAAAGSGEIGMGMQLGMQMKMQEAQIANIEANTAKTKVDTAKTAGVDTQAVTSSIEQMKANTQNLLIKNEIDRYEAKIREVENTIAQHTQQDIIGTIRAEKERLKGVAEQEKNAGKINTETYDTTKKLIEQSATEQSLRISAQKLGLIKSDADIQQVQTATAKIREEIEAIQQSIGQRWTEIDQKQQEIEIRKVLQKLTQMQIEFNTSTPEKIKQWTSIIGNLIPLAPGTH